MIGEIFLVSFSCGRCGECRPAGIRSVLVGGPNRLPGRGIFHREQGLELTPETRPSEEVLGYLLGSVGESHQAQPRLPQITDAVGNVRVQAQRLETGHHVAHRLVETAGQGNVTENPAQDLGSDQGEFRGSAGGGQGEAVPQQRGEPDPGQVGRGADLHESGAQRRHVGEGLVDVEHNHCGHAGHSGFLWSVQVVPVEGATRMAPLVQPLGPVTPCAGRQRSVRAHLG